jgi:hypothetical protein
MPLFIRDESSLQALDSMKTPAGDKNCVFYLVALATGMPSIRAL